MPRSGTGHASGTGIDDTMNILTSRDVEAADRLALARLDDDGAPAAATSVISHRCAKATPIPADATTPGAAQATRIPPPPSRTAAGR